MHSIIKAVTRPDDPPRWADRKIADASRFVRRQIASIGGKRLASQEELQRFRDKYAKKPTAEA